MSKMTSSPAEIQRKLDWTVEPLNEMCGCMGPQRDEPLCPCAMNSVIKWRGRWVKLSVIGDDTVGDDYLSDLAPGQPGEGTCSPPDIKTEYEVILRGYTGSKIDLVREVRRNTGLGLFETKDLVDHLPKAIKKGVSKEEAEYLRNVLEAVDAIVELR